MRYENYSTRMSIKELFEIYTHQRFDLNPAFQREEVASPKFKRKLIRDIIRVGFPTNIILRELDDGRLQVIDGLQRISTIIEYMNNEFKCLESAEIYYGDHNIILPAVTLKEMHTVKNGDALFDLFINSSFNVTIFKNITDLQAAEIFRIFNDCTTLNDQEQRNGNVHLLAQWVRDHARLENRLPVFKSATFGKGRMKSDDMLARCLQYEYFNQKKEKGIYERAVTRIELDALYENAMYTDNEKNLSSLTREVVRRLKLVNKILEDSQAPFISKQSSRVINLYLLIYALEEEFGKGFKMDTKVFSKAYADAFTKLFDKKLMGLSHRNQTRFAELMGKYSPLEVMERTSIMLNYLKDNYSDLGITSTDPTRCFTQEEKYRKWIEQDCKCAVSGADLEFSDAVGGHIIPHSKGGSTTYDNLVILSAEVNTAMSDMTMDEYLQKVA